MSNNHQQIKQPLGIFQERYDIKKGISRKMASHLNEPSTWWDALNFRFYKQNILTVPRKLLYVTPIPSTQSLVIPNNTCQINLNVMAPPSVESDTIYVAFGVNFTYQIVAPNATSFDAINLPSGVSVNTKTGLIAGNISKRPQTSFTVNISGTNRWGQGHGTLTIVIATAQIVFNYLNANLDGTPSTSLPLNPLVLMSIDGGSFATPVVGTVYHAVSNVTVRYTSDAFVASVAAIAVNSATITGIGGSFVIALTSYLKGNFTTTSALEATEIYGGVCDMFLPDILSSDVYNNLETSTTTSFSSSSLLLGMSYDWPDGFYSNVVFETSLDLVGTV